MTRQSISLSQLCMSLPLALAFAASPALATPYADFVVSYDAGNLDPMSEFRDSSTALGAPNRTIGGPSDVTVFNAPFSASDVVSIGEGGQLTVGFNSPILDDANNPFGIDLIIFGNAFFTAPFGTPSPTITGIFGETATISVSENGTDFITVPDVFADDLFPTQGFTDTTDLFGNSNDGSTPTDFTLPVDPSLTLDNFIGLDYAGVLALYNGSGGGAGVDISSVGLSSVSFVRIDGVIAGAAEIDGFADVSAIPEPGTALLLGLGLIGLGRRARTKQGSLAAR